MLIKSEKNTNYLFCKKHKQILFINPVLSFIIEMNSKGKKIVDSDQILLEAQKVLSSDEYQLFSNINMTYLTNLYNILCTKGYFAKELEKGNKIKRYSSGMIEHFIANTEMISFEVTDKCNLSCTYCGYGKFYKGYDNRKGGNIDIASAKAVIEFVIALKSKHFNNIKSHRKIGISFYGGEPLLNFYAIRNIVEMIKQINIKDFVFQFTITTNGILLNKYIDFLVENDFILGISLDGSKENNVYRVLKDGKISFDIVYKNAKMIKEKYPDYFRSNVTFPCVMHNKNNFFEVMRFFVREFGKVPLMNSLAGRDLNKANINEFESIFKKIKNDKSEEDDMISLKKEIGYKFMPRDTKLENFITNNCESVHGDIRTLLNRNNKELKINHTGTCNPFEKKIFVTVNGKILPCERISQKYALGHVKKTLIKLDYKKIANQYNEYYRKIYLQCENCANRNQCTQCIFQIPLHRNKIKCNSFQSKAELYESYSKSLTMFEKEPSFYKKIFHDLQNKREV
jgi:uncharacterized protein